MEAAIIFSGGGFFGDECSPVSRMELVEPIGIGLKVANGADYEFW
jgi:hypothetical protein